MNDNWGLFDLEDVFFFSSFLCFVLIDVFFFFQSVNFFFVSLGWVVVVIGMFLGC